MRNHTGYFDRQRQLDNVSAYLFIAPALLAFGLFTVLPMLMSFVLTTFKYNYIQPAQFVGTLHFRRLWIDPTMWKTFFNTLKFLAILVPMYLVLGLVLAYFTHRIKQRALRSAYRGILYFPTLITSASVAYVWGYMFSRDTGFINYYLRNMGLQAQPWMTDAHLVYVTIALFSFWKYIGSTFLYYFIGLQNIPGTYYEAAIIDGAKPRQVFFHVTLPLLSPIVFFVLTMNLINVFQIFDEPFMITRGGPADASKSLAMYIYETAFVKTNTGYGSVMSVFLFLIILAVTIIQFKMQNRWVVSDYE